MSPNWLPKNLFEIFQKFLNICKKGHKNVAVLGKGTLNVTDFVVKRIIKMGKGFKRVVSRDPFYAGFQ